MNSGINVLSLFDGISCGQLALQRSGIKVSNYYASEIDKHAIKVTQANFPDTIQLGNITGVEYTSGGEDVGILSDDRQMYFHAYPVDLILAGSPCQGFSFAGKQLNFNDPRSKLFFEFVRILKEVRVHNPQVKFLLENVKMKRESMDIISEYLGVQPIEINSSLVSAQNRKRLYWTNIESIIQPKDKKILLKDIIFKDALPITYTERRTEEAKKIRQQYMRESGRDFSPRRAKELIARRDDKSNCLTATFSNKEHLILTKKAMDYMDRLVSGGRNHWDFKHHSDIQNEKSAAVVANFFKGIPYNILKDFDCIRAFDPIECERLQTLPDNYTFGVSDTQRYKAIGNGWTVDVIMHILKYM